METKLTLYTQHLANIQLWEMRLWERHTSPHILACKFWWVYRTLSAIERPSASPPRDIFPIHDHPPCELVRHSVAWTVPLLGCGHMAWTVKSIFRLVSSDKKQLLAISHELSLPKEKYVLTLIRSVDTWIMHYMDCQNTCLSTQVLLLILFRQCVASLSRPDCQIIDACKWRVWPGEDTSTDASHFSKASTTFVGLIMIPQSDWSICVSLRNHRWRARSLYGHISARWPLLEPGACHELVCRYTGRVKRRAWPSHYHQLCFL